ncbi:hypothetical protein [Streptomyces sp. LaPpAH-108]|uniref:hypothetical protein n=1 Tax=Streptomyces sp. LaPpAH-108 TaxID=1155714 RepID=UPI00036C9AD2|nr:hypothetical protein [Streptomyces sp. LaPpAH-108]
MGFSHPEESAVELAISEPGGEYVSHVRFKPTLLGFESVRDRGSGVITHLPRDSVRCGELERRLPADFLGKTVDIP